MFNHPQEAFEAYSEHFRNSPAHVLRDCLELVSDAAPISVDEVEPAEAIMTRFCTGGMSLGAISRETHETIAIAMNRIGGASCYGLSASGTYRARSVWLRGWPQIRRCPFACREAVRLPKYCM